MDRDEKTARPKRFLLAVNEPPSCDGWDEVIRVEDMENFEMSPDGGYVFPRRGSAIHQSYPLPDGEIRMQIESRVPNLNDGSELAMIIGPNGISDLLLTRDRINLPGDSLDAQVWFNPADYYFNAGDLVDDVTMIRTGALDKRVVVNYDYQEFYADSGGPIDGAGGSASTTFEPGVTSKFLSQQTSASTVVNPHTMVTTYKSYAFRISSVENGSIGPTDTANLLPNSVSLATLVKAGQPMVTSNAMPLIAWSNGELICYALNVGGSFDLSQWKVVQWSDTVCVFRTPVANIVNFKFYDAVELVTTPAFLNGSTEEVVDPTYTLPVATSNQLFQIQDVSNQNPVWCAVNSNGILYFADQLSVSIGDGLFMRIYKIDITAKTYVGLTLLRLPDDQSGSVQFTTCDMNGDIGVAYQRDLADDGDRTWWFSKFNPSTSVTLSPGVQLGDENDSGVQGAVCLASGAFAVVYDDGISEITMRVVNANCTTATEVGVLNGSFHKVGVQCYGDRLWLIDGTDAKAYNAAGTLTGTRATSATAASHLGTLLVDKITDSLQTIVDAGTAVAFPVVEKYGGEGFDATVADMMTDPCVVPYNAGLGISSQVGAR